MNISPSQFVENLGRSGLVSRSHLDRELQMFTSTRWNNTKPFAMHLVAQGFLTEWQAKNLLNGKYKGFLLGDLKILNIIRNNVQTREYLAEDQRLQRRVAVKVLRPRHNGDSQELERFLRSIRALARMAHPNILQALGVQVELDVNFAVVEHFDGETLESLVARSGPLEFCLAIRLFVQMVRAVQHAHDRGVILRALSPATVLVDGSGRLKLESVDWVRIVNDDQLIASLDPLHQMAVEYAEFLSPESVLASVDLDGTADVYSLGCILYFMLAGRSPFAGQTISNVLRSHQTSEPRSLRDIRDDVPVTVYELCATMMAKKREQRLCTQKIIAIVDNYFCRN